MWWTLKAALGVDSRTCRRPTWCIRSSAVASRLNRKPTFGDLPQKRIVIVSFLFL